MSHRAFMMLNHRIILAEKTTPETGKTTLTAEIYRQRINQKAKARFSTYHIPAFFKWVVLNPVSLYESLSKNIENWQLLNHDTTEDCDIVDNEARKLLTTIVLCRFISLENAQYFSRASHSERAENLFTEFSEFFEDRALELLKAWKEKSTPSRIMENMCLHQHKRSKDQDDFVIIPNKYSWRKRNIVDIARLGKMHKLIRSEFMLAQDEPVFACESWPRRFRFFLSLMSLGLLSPILLNYTKEIFMKRTFCNDTTGKTLQYQSVASAGQDTPGHPTEPKIKKCIPWPKWSFFEEGYWKHWLLFHSSPMAKLGYSFLTELLFMFYFSFYIRNCLLYQWNKYDWVTIVIIIIMMFGRIKARVENIVMHVTNVCDLYDLLVKHFSLKSGTIIQYFDFW